MGTIARAVLLIVAAALSGCASVSLKESPPASRAVAPTPTVATKACPQGYRLVANAWERSKLPAHIRARADAIIKVAEDRDTLNATKLDAYKGDAFSRTLGGELRHEVKTRAAVNANLRVRLLDQQSGALVHDLGVVLHIVNGVGSIVLSAEQTKYVVETVWPSNFVSPAISGSERRLRMFSWDYCTKNIHGLVP